MTRDRSVMEAFPGTFEDYMALIREMLGEGSPVEAVIQAIDQVFQVKDPDPIVREQVQRALEGLVARAGEEEQVRRDVRELVRDARRHRPRDDADLVEHVKRNIRRAIATGDIAAEPDVEDLQAIAYRGETEAAAEAHPLLWKNSSVEFTPIPGLRFLDHVPADLVDAWQVLLTVPRKMLVWDRIGKAKETHPVMAALEIVRQHLEVAHYRPPNAGRWRLPDSYNLDGWPYAEIPNVVHVLRAVWWHHALAVATWGPARTAADRKAEQRQRDKEKVEEIFRHACRACAGTRPEVRRFDLHHPGGDGGGVDREVDTDKLRREVIAYHDLHDVQPPHVEMLCHPCHQYQTKAQRNGCRWGDRIDVRTGEPYDGTDFPEGLVHTRPVPAPTASRKKRHRDKKRRRM